MYFGGITPITTIDGGVDLSVMVRCAPSLELIKAFAPISVTVEAIVAVERFLLYANAPIPIVFTPSGIVISLRLHL